MIFAGIGTLDVADVAAAGADHDRDVLVGERLDGRLDEPATGRRDRGALGDVDDGAVASSRFHQRGGT